jgi:hypothetical protein
MFASFLPEILSAGLERVEAEIKREPRSMRLGTGTGIGFERAQYRAIHLKTRPSAVSFRPATRVSVAALRRVSIVDCLEEVYRICLDRERSITRQSV